MGKIKICTSRFRQIYSNLRYFISVEEFQNTRKPITYFESCVHLLTVYTRRKSHSKNFRAEIFMKFFGRKFH